MAFGQKVEAKDILGMETEEFHSRLGKVDSIESRIAKMEEESRAANSTILERLDALKPKEPVREAVDPDVEFLANPNQAINNRLDPLAKQTTDNTIMLMHRNAREQYPRDFERWGTEIVAMVGQYAPMHQADPRIWENCVYVVRGKHAMEIEKDGATGKYNFLEPVSAGIHPDPKTADGLDDNQRMMVRKLRNMGPKELTPEKYKAGQARLEKSRNDRMGSFGRAS